MKNQRKQTLPDLCFFGEGAGEAGAAPDASEQDAAKQDAAKDGAARNTEQGPAEAGRRTPEAARGAGPFGGAAGKGAPGPQAEEQEPPEQAEDPDFRQVLAKAALAARFKAAEAAAARWEQEAEDLKRIYPFFSLEQSLRTDKGFTSLLKAGVPVRLAFEAANLEKILGAAMRYAAGTAGKRTVQSILAGGGRVRENPVLDRAASVRKKDVGSLTDREILKILKQVGNGERITF